MLNKGLIGLLCSTALVGAKADSLIIDVNTPQNINGSSLVIQLIEGASDDYDLLLDQQYSNQSSVPSVDIYSAIPSYSLSVDSRATNFRGIVNSFITKNNFIGPAWINLSTRIVTDNGAIANKNITGSLYKKTDNGWIFYGNTDLKNGQSFNIEKGVKP